MPKYVEIPQIQERETQVRKIETVERIVDVPRNEIQEKLVERPIEEIVTVLSYVAIPKIITKVTNQMVEQPQRTSRSCGRKSSRRASSTSAWLSRRR